MPILRANLLLLALLAPTALADTLNVEPWPLPAAVGSGQPDLTPTPEGHLLLSWIQRLDTGHALEMARQTHDGWSPITRIARGERWFVNWADTPHTLALPDGSLWAHWLERSGEGTYDYGIRLVRSEDGGTTWSAPISPHPQGLPLDFGFVSLWPAAPDRLGIAWLDSRQKAEHAGHAGHGHDHHGPGGPPMSFHTTEVGPDLSPGTDIQLDASTCDCCTTAVAMTNQGAVLAYRARREEEVRDIKLVRHTAEGWSAPLGVHADGWKIPGCPVNGPVLAARGDLLWIAWYTEAEGRPALRLARSTDAGASIGPMREWAAGPEQLGRPALAADADGLWLAWMEEGQGTQSLWLARLDHALAERSRIKVADLQLRGRASGFPRVASRDGIAHVVWTDVVEGRPRLHGARVSK